jgi:hypothetical protein
MNITIAVISFIVLYACLVCLKNLYRRWWYDDLTDDQKKIIDKLDKQHKRKHKK